MPEFLTLAIKPETLRPIFINKKNEVGNEAIDGFELRFNWARPFDLKYAKIEDSVSIDRLPFAALLPERKIHSFATGKVEEYRHTLGFTSADICPEDPTIAMWASTRSMTPNFELLYGGPDLEVIFPKGKWMGLDRKTPEAPETLISLRQQASGIKFRKKNTVSEWVPIQEK